MAICTHYYNEVELDNGSVLRIEYAQWVTPATWDDPEEVETSEYNVYVDGKRVYELGELEHIAQELFESGDACIMPPPDMPF